MEINYRTRKLERLSLKNSTRQKELGQIRAKNFEKRISELSAAECLEDLRHLPQAGIHELSGNRVGEFSANLSGNFRLIFVPDQDPEPRKVDGAWDWNAITIIEITEITDYHGR